MNELNSKLFAPKTIIKDIKNVVQVIIFNMSCIKVKINENELLKEQLTK